ncbi:MAG: hypothetical protein IJC91_05185, partial [Oscillospiraceae bacterium]|nr:hypothetical protein [Oscillospiraceae bacterium]
MNNRANTKQALLSSVIALLICFAMLFGTTFAWFTDEVTNANNIIKTGTLKVVATYGDSLTGVEDNNLENQGDTAPKGVFYYDNWEPGYTHVKYFRIKNDGSLAFKYQLNIVPTVAPVDGEVNLADVIDVYFVNPADKEYARDDFASMTPVATVAQLMAETDGAARGVLHPVGNKDGKASD